MTDKQKLVCDLALQTAVLEMQRTGYKASVIKNDLLTAFDEALDALTIQDQASINNLLDKIYSVK